MTTNVLPIHPTVSNAEDDEWENIDADNSILTFDTVGQTEEGIYQGEETVRNKKKGEDMLVLAFRRENGLRWRTWSKADLQAKLATVQPGQYVKVIYLGRVGGGNVGKHLFDVKRKKS